MDFSSFTIENVANGLLFIIIGLLSWLGIKKGGERVKPPEQVAEIAGALVDASSIAELVRAIREYGEEQKQSRAQSKDNAKALERAIGSLTKEVEELHTETGRLREEMIRGSRSSK